MALKDILLHIDNTPSFPNRLDLAISLARLHGAHLKGLYVVTHPYYTPDHSAGDVEMVRRIEALFKEKVALAGISGEWLYVDWSVVGVGVTEVINRYAYFTDLVIIGQPNHDSPDRDTPKDLPERLGLGAGRPLLVVPYAGTFNTIGERVMIAWKSGREATRSASDALPILEKAKHVSVVTISPAGNFDSNEIEDARKICSHLAHHGINATHDQVLASFNLSIGDMLLNHACEQRMDLLVMGAYAQSRRGGYMHSPVARHLMNFMTVPMLVSH
ncbi:MAG: universal stress protein [Desulfuromonadales bacterium]|nr:universal stress protein [Desulfuromonadales bacterium]